ncbi:MAG: diguanylate cyclase [Chitinispirillaceae bacterium]|nr:diguanylate cyclase [Chitinispirillaceae bacterium]
MTQELPFTGFQQYIKDPLVSSDQRSLALIKRCFIEDPVSPHHPFATLIQKLTGNAVPYEEALTCWKQILKHKISLQQKLGRTVGIQTAAIDYFEYQSPIDMLFKISPPAPEKKPSTSAVTSETIYPQGGYHLEKLKEEMLRAKRYKHALSVIMLDIDTSSDEVSTTEPVPINDNVFSTIVNIIKKTIRTVDFLTRLSDFRFFLILPNTNQREAKELAERIRMQIFQRTGRLSSLKEGINSLLSVGQSTDNDSSIDFLRRIERKLDEAKQHRESGVFTLS